MHGSDYRRIIAILMNDACTSKHRDSPRMLIRNVGQLVTAPPGQAPLRGRALADIQVTRDAYIPCDGGRIKSVGRTSDIPALPGETEELDVEAAAAVPGLV